MDLTRMLSAYGSRRAHVLLVEVPGWAETRMWAEYEMRVRGWRLAESAADADVLFVCGNPGQDFGKIIARLWDQLPGPRAKIGASMAEQVAPALGHAVALLTDTEYQQQDASSRKEDTADSSQDESHTDSGHEGMDHGEMDHGEMDMPMPGGVPLAGEGEDRDGLNLDVLNVPVGPVLPNWPAGLVLSCALQGDVVVDSSAEVLSSAPAPAAPSTQYRLAGDDDESIRRRLAASRCDNAKQLLALAGWGAAAAQVERVRDGLLADAGLNVCNEALERVSWKVGRSRLLRWSLGGLHPSAGPSPVTPDQGLRRPEAWTELRGWLADVEALLRQKAAVDPYSEEAARERAQHQLGSLPTLVKGMDLGAVRIVVASLGLDTSLLVGESVGADD